uniref:Thioesterase domain-containing protein n=1 Tax=Kwoniella dejecticola CBS 10117 TaxID=1296121 RepID=A0A1A5ZVD6_9TREE|nr:uncharacterized protein I303_07678 [Kwoniella dejecticola CBS 10117]OBR81768.1 hypothetical protein I303_07678 [Kwoniella dejecticola CBS 10117]
MACLKFLQKAWSTTISKGGHDSNVLSSLRLIEARPKYIKGILTIGQKHLNNHGLTDTITSLSLSTLGYPPPTGVSVNISTEFVRPGGKLHDELMCVGKVEQAGRNLAYTRCEFYTSTSSVGATRADGVDGVEIKEGKEGKLVAYGSQTKFMNGWSKVTSFSEDGRVELGLGLEDETKAKL